MKHSRQCPACRSEFIYEMGRYHMCLNCTHDWEEPVPEMAGIGRALPGLPAAKDEISRVAMKNKDGAEG